jgi:hypothetical protein
MLSWPFTILAFSIFVGIEGAKLFPTAGYWFTVASVKIDNTRVGQSIFMDIDRTIKRPFTAEWSVVVRKVTTEKEIVCTANGISDYQVQAKLPDPTTLDWWSAGDCNSIKEPGEYQITTVWILSPQWRILGQREVIVESNIFTVGA